ncbi:MAG: hypothetical protein MJZ46_03045 [Bacteroidales bacterium]|nr:hypothetical protein [Bacteroidales bacterium]
MKSVCSKLMMILLAVACCTLVSCKKEEVKKDDTTQSSEEFTFVGNYDLEIVTDSLGSDGTWFSREFYEEMTGKHEGPFYGRLTITQDNATTFKIVGKVLVGTDSMEYYNTTAVLDANGNLLPEPSSLVSDFTHNFTYGPIAPQNPLVFRTERHVPTYDMDWGYIMTNTATKR